MRKLLYAVLLGLVGAGIVHILVLMMVPELSERDAWSRLSMASDLYRMTPLEAESRRLPFRSERWHRPRSGRRKSAVLVGFGL
jgi:uncharacterized membrane protein